MYHFHPDHPCHQSRYEPEGPKHLEGLYHIKKPPWPTFEPSSWKRYKFHHMISCELIGVRYLWFLCLHFDLSDVLWWRRQVCSIWKSWLWCVHKHFHRAGVCSAWWPVIAAMCVVVMTRADSKRIRGTHHCREPRGRQETDDWEEEEEDLYTWDVVSALGFSNGPQVKAIGYYCWNNESVSA